MDEIAHESAV